MNPLATIKHGRIAISKYLLHCSFGRANRWSSVHNLEIGVVARSSSSLFALAAVLVLTTMLVAAAEAQVATASINGRVQDQTLSVIPDATVSATQTATGYVNTTTSNAEGFFNFATLPVGSYTITVQAAGFETYKQTGIVLTVGQSLSVTAGLTIGASTETVSVTAAAVALDSTSPTVQSTIGEKVVEGLPLNGRNPATLAFTVAGVTDSTLNVSVQNTQTTVKASDASSPQESAPSVHGARPGGTYFSLDGASNTDPFSVIGGPFPNPDATGEFTVVTGTYGSQYVSAPGGAINIVTRSGANQIHGTAFEFIRNGYFNARNALSTEPDVLKRNQFGFALGAPLLRNRLFAFGSYQATPTHNSTTMTNFFPTAAQRMGNFGTFQIPQALLSPLTQKILADIPLGAPGTGALSYQVPNNSNDQQGVAKVDLDAGKHRLFARAFYDRYTLAGQGETPIGLAAAVHTGIIQPWLSAALGDTWTRNELVLQTTASFTRALSTVTSPTTGLGYGDLGVTNLSGDPQNPGFALLLVNGFFSVNGDTPTEQFPREQIEVAQNTYFTKGRNQLSFGFNYRHVKLDESNLGGQNPIAIYYGVNSYVDGLYGIIPGATLNPMADFILGAPYVFYQQDGFYSKLSGNLFGVYGEDNIRLTKKLTLTAGLRWDPNFPYTPSGGRITCFSPGSQSNHFTNALPGLLFPGDPGCPAAGVQNSLAEIQPRVGLAYSANNGTTAIRAGYGRYDLQFPLNAYIGFSAQPWSRTYELVQPFLSIDNVWASAGLTNPFSAGFQTANYNPSQNVAFQKGLAASTFNQNFHPGYVNQWSLSVQQQLSRADQVELAYIGTAGVHLTLGVSGNTPVYGPGASASNEQARRPYEDFGNIYELSSSGTSSYNGVDVTYRHQSKSFSLTSAFTWSKSLDDNSLPVSAGTANIPFDEHNFRRGRSDFDQNLDFRNTLVLNGPKFENLNYAARSVLGAWSLSGLAVVDAGQPFSVLDGSDNSYTGLELDYADRVPGVPLYEHGRLNVSAFTDNAPGTFGNSGRNAYRAPSNKDVDVAAIKQFPIKREIGLTFRAESFNIFNHPNYIPTATTYTYGAPGTAANALFGSYVSARDPRILQFSLKASF